MDERDYLLLTSNKSSSSDNSTDDLRYPKRSRSPLQIQLYGAISNIVGKIVPLDKRITYTWSDLNVFTSGTLSAKRGLFPFLSKEHIDVSSATHILRHVSGIAYPGQLLVILGASGSGKTTLLNSLTFRQVKCTTATGLICVNGIPASSKCLTSQSAYIQQDDLFIGCLTVREHLVFQALVRMDRHYSYTQRMKRVDEVILEFALTNCEHSYIGIPNEAHGISGGERKRLSFAAEVLTNPSLFFCDEPTSGLDSFMALNLVQVLKSMAQTGKTVICTLHQPSSELYGMFDKILLMTEGKTAFLGSPEEADMFFAELEAPCPKNYNPADFFIQLLAIIPEREESCKQAVDMICDQFDKSPIGVKIQVEAATVNEPSYNELWISEEVYRNPYKASWFAQFRAVLWRSWLSIMKEPMLINVRITQTIMVALICGAIYFRQELNQDGTMNINGALFVFLTSMTFQNVYAVVNVFCTELPIFLREHRNGMYRTDVYFICKTLAEAPLFCLIPILFTSICYYIIGLNAAVSKFFVACGIVTLVTNGAISFGYFISCLSRNVSMALSIGPPVIIPFLLFGGFFLNVNSIPVYLKWLSFFSWFRYGNEALLINQWTGVDHIDCPIVNSTCPRNGHVILESYNFNEDNFTWDITALCILIIVFRFMAYLCLLVRTYLVEI